MNTIATLYQLRQFLGLADSDTDEDARLRSHLEAATQTIERFAGRQFCPYHATIIHDIDLYIPDELILEDDLLSLTTIVNGDGQTIDSANIVHIPDGAGIPTGVIQLINGESLTYTDSHLSAIQVTGIWGWHDAWTLAWKDSLDTVQDNPLSNSVTTLTVNDADGTDEMATPPRFQVGQLLQIESEYLRVLAVDTATNTLTVLRGVNGTTANSHAQGTAISVYQPPHDVMMLCVRYAAWLYKEPDHRLMRSMPVPMSGELAMMRRTTL